MTYARVLRGGEAFEINSEELVPGDIVLMEDGAKVPADLRLLAAQNLEIDESLLTGESLPVNKNPVLVVEADAPVGDRKNMGFAGTLVTRGRGRGVVVATALKTEVGRLAETLLERGETKPPLLLRMEKFTYRIAQAVGAAAVAIFGVGFWRGEPLADVFMQSVALAVSAIPEGLPVALTAALAIGMNRMAKRNVIIRRLVAVESLGSCDFIASDKTGTLTMNEMTVRVVAAPSQPEWQVTGEGDVPEGGVRTQSGMPTDAEQDLLKRLSVAAVLCNEGFLGLRDGRWVHHGDAVDMALLVMAHKLGVIRSEMTAAHPQTAQIPFDS